MSADVIIISETGPQGAPGPGAITGGTTGQALVKASGTDYDFTWGSFDPAGSAATAQAAAIAFSIQRANHTGTQASSTITTAASSRILGRTTTGAGAVEELTAAQAKTLLSITTSDVSGLGALATQSTVTTSQISDSTAAGRALLTAANAAAQVTLLGAIPTAEKGTPDGVQELDGNGIADSTTLGVLDAAIIEKGKLAAALGASSSRRVAVVGIGDSNQAYTTTGGWGAAFQKWLYSYYGCFGTGLLPLAAPYSNNVPGYLSGSGRNNVGATSGAPASLHAYSPGGGDIPNEGIYSYCYVASGSTQGIASTQWSMIISPEHPIGISGALKFRMSYGTFVSGGPTTISPRVRGYTSPFTTIVTGDVINPVTGAFGVVDYVMNVAAGVRSEAYAMMPGDFGSTISGPWIMYYGSAENSDKSTGLSYSTLLRDGGSSLYDMLVALNTHGDQALTEYFRQHRLQLTGTIKSMVFFINSGLNDQGDIRLSLGPIGGLVSSTAAGFGDNLNGIIAKLQANWIAAGGTADTIHFCTMVSHPYVANDGGESGLPRYRKEAARIARTRSNCSAIILPAIRSYEAYVANSWFDAGGNFHLTATGYDAVTRAVIREITRNTSAEQFSPVPVSAAGTAATLTNTSAALDFGTTDPQIQIFSPGRYVLRARFQLKGNAATIVAETVSLKLRRTNNTAADVTGATTTITPAAVTTSSATIGVFDLPEVIYTAGMGDIITLFGNVSATLGAGSVQVSEASIVATPVIE